MPENFGVCSHYFFVHSFQNRTRFRFLLYADFGVSQHIWLTQEITGCHQILMPFFTLQLKNTKSIPSTNMGFVLRGLYHNSTTTHSFVSLFTGFYITYPNIRGTK